MSKWQVSSNYVGGDRLYQVYRIRNDSETDHSGNREIRATFKDKRLAQIMADAMNGDGYDVYVDQEGDK